MKKFRLMGAACVALALSLGACTSTVRPHINSLDPASVQQAASVAFLIDGPLVMSNPEMPDFPAQRVDQQIRDSIEAGLTAKGYRFAPGVAGTDMLIGYTIGARQDSDQYVEAYRGRFHRLNTVVITEDDYVEGSLVIDLIDAQSGELLWSGSAKRDFHSKPGERLPAIIDDAVSAILASLPSK